MLVTCNTGTHFGEYFIIACHRLPVSPLPVVTGPLLPLKLTESENQFCIDPFQVKEPTFRVLFPWTTSSTEAYIRQVSTREAKSGSGMQMGFLVATGPFGGVQGRLLPLGLVGTTSQEDKN